jgi:hypothetical protein
MNEVTDFDQLVMCGNPFQEKKTAPAAHQKGCFTAVYD